MREAVTVDGASERQADVILTDELRKIFRARSSIEGFISHDDASLPIKKGHVERTLRSIVNRQHKGSVPSPKLPKSQSTLVAASALARLPIR